MWCRVPGSGARAGEEERVGVSSPLLPDCLHGQLTCSVLTGKALMGGKSRIWRSCTWPFMTTAGR